MMCVCPKRNGVFVFLRKKYVLENGDHELVLEAGAAQGLRAGKVQKKQKEKVGFFSFYGAGMKQKGFYFLFFLFN
jgi:hypothetical protein